MGVEAVEGLGAVADHACRDAGGAATGGEGVGDAGACGHDGSVADGDARGDDDVRAQPYVVADADGLVTAGLLADQLVCGDAVVRGEDHGAGAAEKVAADGDGAAG